MKQISAPFLLLLTCSSLYTPQAKAVTVEEILKAPVILTAEAITGLSILAYLAFKKENIEVTRERTVLKEKEAAIQKDLNQSEIKKQEALNQVNLKQEQEVLKLHAQAKQKEIEQQNAQKMVQAQQFVKRIQAQYNSGTSAADLESYAKRQYSAINNKTPHLLFCNDVKKELETLQTLQAFFSQQEFVNTYNFLNGIYQGLNYYHGETITKQQNHKRDAELELEKKLIEIQIAKRELEINVSIDERVKKEQKILDKIENYSNKFAKVSDQLTLINDNIVATNSNMVKKVDDLKNTLQNQEFWKNVTNVINQTLEFEKQEQFRTRQDRQYEELLKQVKNVVGLVEALHNRPAPANPETTNPAPTFYHNPYNPHGGSSSY